MTDMETVKSREPEAYAYDVFGDGGLWWICLPRPDSKCPCNKQNLGDCPYPERLGPGGESEAEAWENARAVIEDKVTT